MIYRCRWCERGYCEDCLDWEKTDLLGENLQEYELLGFPAVSQAYYIKCPNCTDHHVENEEARLFCQSRAKEIDEQYQEQLKQQALDAAASEVNDQTQQTPNSIESLTEAPTVDSSGISTPRYAPEQVTTSKKQKRKGAPGFRATPTKQSKKQRLTLNGPRLGPFEQSSIKELSQTLDLHDRTQKKSAKRPTI